MVVVLNGENNVDVKYEIHQPPRDWCAMDANTRQKFAKSKNRWTVDIRINQEGGDHLTIFDITTPTTLKEASATTKYILDEEFGNASMIYGAIFTITVK